MKRLAPRVNVIPVVGRADSLTPAELAESKKLVMEDIEHYRIPVYNFPYDIEEDDEDTVEENAELRGLMPFAIVGSEDVVEIGGRTVRARQYPWGVVEVDNPRHSDFLAIRSALLHSHLADLKEITHDFLYENYRTEKLSKSVEGGAGVYVNSLSQKLQALLLTSPSQRLFDEPRRLGLPVRSPQGGATPPRRGEAARDRDQGPTRDQREAPRTPCSGVPAPRNRGAHAARGRSFKCGHTCTRCERRCRVSTLRTDAASAQRTKDHSTCVSTARYVHDNTRLFLPRPPSFTRRWPVVSDMILMRRAIYILAEKRSRLGRGGTRGCVSSAKREWTWPFSPDNDIPWPIRCLQEMQFKEKVEWEIGREDFPRFLFIFCASDGLLFLMGQPFSWTFGIFFRLIL